MHHDDRYKDCVLPLCVLKFKNDTFYRTRLQHRGFLIRRMGNFFLFIRSTAFRDPEALSHQLYSIGIGMIKLIQNGV